MTQPLHIRIAATLYMAMPVSHSLRRKLRDKVFTHGGFVFKSHPAYQHWLHGKHIATREVQTLINDNGLARAPKAPKPNDWYKLAMTQRQRTSNAALIDIIIPVYKGYDETLRAIYAAISAPHKTPREVIVINDASPDKALARELRHLAAMGLFTYLENSKNLGFVKTVNRGLDLHKQRDCIILNADCIVYGNFADRLIDVAKSQPNVATVTPLTNNGEICSYPLAFHDNIWRNERSDADMDALCAHTNGLNATAVPTGVGYCMFMSRATMNEIGYFDAETFGRGYGEENDFCLRAAEKNYIHLMAGGIFVRHLGGASFQGEKAKRVQKAIKTLDRLHPGYTKQIMDWQATNPAKPMRMALDLARLGVQSKPSMLLVLHTWGGGTEKHVRDMARWLEEEGIQVFWLMPLDTDPFICQLGLFDRGDFAKTYTPNLRFDIRHEHDMLGELLGQLDIRHIHIHHLIGYEDDYYAAMPTLAAAIGARYDVTLHDYFSICPRTNLIDGNNLYCGEPEAATCNQCIIKNGSPVTRYKDNEPEIVSWRAMHHAFLQTARQVYTPSNDLASRLARYFSDITCHVRPHPEDFIHPLQPSTTPVTDVKKIALIGALHELKGALVLKELAKDAHARKLPLEFHIFGYYAVADAGIFSYGNVFESGKFKEKDLPELIAAAQPQAALFLSVWPETFSYTLSQAYQLGLYPVSFDIGAPAERIRQCDWGTLMPLELAHTPGAINDILMGLDIPPQPDSLAIWDKKACYESLIRDYYALDSALFDESTLKQAS